jgi:hypothetical protein
MDSLHVLYLDIHILIQGPYRFTIDTLMQSVVKNIDWGINGANLWVDNRCRATFSVEISSTQ